MAIRWWKKIPVAHRSSSRVVSKDFGPVESSLLYLYDQITDEIGGDVPNVSDYQITVDDDMVFMSGDNTATLPAIADLPAGKAWGCHILNVGSGTVTLIGSLGTTISEEASQAIGPHECITVRTDGTNWWVI